MTSLAVDAICNEYDEAKKYSELIRYVFGNKTFFLKDLKNIMKTMLSEKDFECLMITFNLSSKTKFFSKEEINNAADNLKILGKYFLTVSRINSLLEEAKRLNSLNDVILNESTFFNDWEVKIESLPIPALTKNSLIKHKIYTLNDLSNYSKRDIFYIRSIGKKGLAKLQEVIQPYGLELR